MKSNKKGHLVFNQLRKRDSFGKKKECSKAGCWQDNDNNEGSKKQLPASNEPKRSPLVGRSDKDNGGNDKTG